MYSVAIQLVATNQYVPSKSLLRLWALETLAQNLPRGKVTLRIVDVEEMTELNTQYRHKSGPTNVLSFPIELPKDIEVKTPLLGDIVICAEVVNKEAGEQNKDQNAHWAHMIVHGVYHLLGYDHENDTDAEDMEAREIATLDTLGFANPYQTREDI